MQSRSHRDSSKFDDSPRDRPRVLITDYPGESLDIERDILSTVNAEIILAPETDEATLASLARDVDAIITCFAQVTAPVLESATRCKTVARTGVGLDNIAVDRATELGMIVSNVVDYCTDEVADHALALLLALTRRLAPLNRNTADGHWDRHAAPVPTRLRGKTLGLVGMGAIGQALVSRARALGLNVTALKHRTTLPEGVTTVHTLDELLRHSDFVSLHLPLTEATQQIIGKDQLDIMKPSSILINTARGRLVDTEALLIALQDGSLAGAGLDVTDPEPLRADHSLRTHENVILTPHSAYASDGSLAELSSQATQNVVAILEGRHPQSIVNPAVLQLSALRLSGESI